jgi:hypothetical protein
MTLTYAAILAAVVFFLLQWSAKHLLDRLVLPRFLDWWALQSNKTALKRAAYLEKQFEIDLKVFSNVHLLVLRIEDRRTRLFTFLFGVNLATVLAVLAHLYFPEDKANYQQFGSLLLAIIVMCTSSIFRFISDNKKDYVNFADFNEYRARTVQRLEQLFAAADLDKKDIRERLALLPAVPLSTP